MDQEYSSICRAIWAPGNRNSLRKLPASTGGFSSWEVTAQGGGPAEKHKATLMGDGGALGEHLKLQEMAAVVASALLTQC